MGELSFSDLNERASVQGSRKKTGITISPVAALILLLLAVCLSVLVGLIVHFASPGKVNVTCSPPAGNLVSSNPSELKGQCLELITGGDNDVCAACPIPATKPTMQPTAKPTSTATAMKPTTAITTITTTIPTTPAPVINYRLPTSVKPWHYNLELQPEIYGQNSSLFTFNGSVSIILNVTQATSNITLHKKDLTINDDIELKVIEDSSMVAPKVINTSDNEVRQFVVLHLDNDLDPSYSYELSMTFESKIRNDKSGLYLSSYKDGNDTVYLATTLFVPPDARKVFPCFDEPAMKATFDVTLVRKEGTGRNYKTFANTDVVSSETRGDYIAEIHGTTPRMSTYLLAFIVCDFDYYENRTSNVDYRTIIRPNGLQYVRRAHQYGLDLFDWYRATFEPSYPISKLDNIAIPDFRYGAMENWGLIAYKERLMFIPGETTASFDEWAVRIIAHEIAHQWFGNMVSPKWWKWVWLNEASATFWSHRAVELVYPAKRMMEQFVVQTVHAVMTTDGARTSHPMTNNVGSYEEVEASFNSITYNKGGAVVRMMDFIMGRDNFIQGLNLYLTRHQYSVAEHRDLLEALTESTLNGTFINMTDIIDPWVTQMNYPVVMVTIVGPGQIHLRQERFLNNMSLNTTGDTAKYDYRWTIPITVASSSDTSNFRKEYTFSDIAWLDKSQVEATLNDSTVPDPHYTDSWVVVNLHQTGFYRVNYEDRNWMALIRQLERDHEVFPPLTRAQIIDDAWRLYKAGLVNMTIALGTLNFLKNETDYVSWRTFARRDDNVDLMLQKSDLYGAFKEFMKDSTKKAYDKWGFEITEDTENINIYQINRGASYACKYGVPKCTEDALNLYRNWMNDDKNNRLNPNIQRTVICNAIRYGGAKEWNFAFNTCRKTGTTALQNDCLYGLSCSREPWLLEKMLHLVLDNSSFKKSDADGVIKNVNKNPQGRELAWIFVKTNFQELENYIGRKSLSKLLTDMSRSFTTAYFISELQDLAAVNMTAEYGKPLQTAIQRTERNVQWLDVRRDVIADWLVERGYGDYIF